MSDEWKDLNPDLIQSDICTQCGRCCKTSWHHTYSVKQEAYLEAMFDKSPRSYVEADPVNQKLKVVNWCSNLLPDLRCGIYKNRPEICVVYNCFAWSNSKKVLPESFAHIFSLLTKKYGEGKVPLYVEETSDDSDRDTERSESNDEGKSTQGDPVGSVQVNEQAPSQ